MARSRRSEARSVDIWPGFVDALSTLLMVMTFLLVVYMLSQFLMNRLLSGQGEDAMTLRQQLELLQRRLADEEDLASSLRQSTARLTEQLEAALGGRDDLQRRLDQSRADQDQAEQQLSLAASEQERLQRLLDEATARQDTGTRQAADLRRQLDEARQIVTADREQLATQLAQLVQLRRDIEALTQVRRDLEAEVSRLAAAQAATTADLGTERDRASALEARLADETERTRLAQRELEQRQIRIEELLDASAALGTERNSAQDRVAELTRQIQALSEQLRLLDTALGEKEAEIASQNTQIADLGQRLNLALASKVEELSQFRSEFFGRLRQLLGERQEVQVVGDRFVFQSEVLFPSGGADMDQEGRAQLAQLAATLKQLIAEIPDDLPWVLQVDGHTDERQISTARFPSNWELSTARAIDVAEFLISQGIPAERVAATGFAEFQPLDPGHNEEAWRRNRRIEIKLTTR